MDLQPTLLASAEEIIPGLAIILGGLVTVIWMVGNMIRKSSAVKQREQSRREIAAYVAEGSMTPEQGERLMNAGSSDMGDGDLCRRIADHVAEGSMTPADAERLIKAGRSPNAG
ncbi:MAG: hypothetical protein AABZ53_10430 [Planctomycetota bacterium]